MTALNEEHYQMIRKYVLYFTRTMPDLLRFQQVDDLVHDVVEKFIKHTHIEKYDSTVTSIKYHIMHGVKTTMIDILRKEKYRSLT